MSSALFSSSSLSNTIHA